MLDEGNNLNMMETPEAPPPEEKNNRTFLVVGGIMAGLVFLTLVCMAVYFLVIAPRLNAQKTSAQATIEAANAQVVQQMTSTAEAALWTPTSLPTSTATETSIPSTPLSSPTPVIAVNTATASATIDPATLVAMQTQLSAQLTATSISEATLLAGAGMPQTGFFDEIGLPGLLILAAALIAIIFLVRRMRKSPAK
jgi:cytoskeletal protein RodZ